MQELVDAVTAGIRPASVRLNAEVSSLSKAAAGWSITTAGSTEEFTNVILALPAYSAATLLSTHTALAEQLRSIRYADSATRRACLLV